MVTMKEAMQDTPLMAWARLHADEDRGSGALVLGMASLLEHSMLEAASVSQVQRRFNDVFASRP